MLGFDCEWVSPRNLPCHPVSLMQLSFVDSDICYLIRLCLLKKVPEELSQILADEKILKYGIGLQVFLIV